MSRIIEAFQGYLLSSDLEGIFFTDPDSIDGCLESVEIFFDKTLQLDNNPWNRKNFHDYEKLCSELAKSYKAVKNASHVMHPSVVTELGLLPEMLPDYGRRPAQPLLIDVEKTKHAVSAALLVDWLHSNCKFAGNESS